jgi:hypothetical protein
MDIINNIRKNKDWFDNFYGINKQKIRIIKRTTPLSTTQFEPYLDLEYIFDDVKKLKKPNFHILKNNIRVIIRECLKYNTTTEKFKLYIGCESEFFIKHIESQFEPWMNWENKSKFGTIKPQPNQIWDIDHIIPLHTALTEEDVVKLNHYSNLRPLCAYKNRFVKRGFV